jgi:uncharacterized protein YuzE
MNKPTVACDPEADAVYIRFSAGVGEASEEVSPGIVLDYDKDGHIVGMEVLQAR